QEKPRRDRGFSWSGGGNRVSNGKTNRLVTPIVISPACGARPCFSENSLAFVCWPPRPYTALRPQRLSRALAEESIRPGFAASKPFVLAGSRYEPSRPPRNCR